MLNRDLFTNDVLYCILNREKEVQRVYTYLSKLLELYDMGDYAVVAGNRIMDDEGIDYAIDNDHVFMDIVNHDLWLDEVALHWFRPILEGYISHEQYNSYLKIIEIKESLRRCQNIALKACREMSLFDLIKHAIKNVRKHENTYQNQRNDINSWYSLELLSRTRIPKLIYWIKKLPDQIKMNLILWRLKKGLRQAFSLKE